MYRRVPYAHQGNIIYLRNRGQSFRPGGEVTTPDTNQATPSEQPPPVTPGTVVADFNSPELGSARWYELDENGQPVRLCISEGAKIVYNAFIHLMNGPAIQSPDGTRSPFSPFVADDWTYALVQTAQRLIPNTQWSLPATGAPRSMNTFDQAGRVNLTRLVLLLAYYWDVAQDRLTLPSARIQVPANINPIAINDPPAGFINPQNLAERDAPAPRFVCYGADALLRPVGQEPNGPLPIPQNTPTIVANESREIPQSFGQAVSSNFNSAELGSARWYELDQNGQPQRLCVWQGRNIEANAYYKLRAGLQVMDAQGTQSPNSPYLADDWMPALTVFVQRYLQNSSLRQHFQLEQIPPLSRMTLRERRLITSLLVLAAAYWIPGENRITLPIEQISIPDNAVPIPFGVHAPAPPATASNQPVCYPANVMLRAVGVEPMGALPVPITKQELLQKIGGFNKTEQASAPTPVKKDNTLMIGVGVAAATLGLIYLTRKSG